MSRSVHRLWSGRALARTAAALVLGSCAAEPAGDRPSGVERRTLAVSIDEVAHSTCGTPDELVTGLSRQLVAAINCLRPGTLAEIPLDADIRMLEPGRPNLIDGRSLADLRAAAQDGDRAMVIRWAYRDVGLQQLFFLQEEYQGCAIAARPGNSNHQNGLAVDLNDWEYWEPIMRRHGWENNLDNDRVHFDYQRVEDLGLGALSLYAFQELWNLNHPGSPLPLDGALDDATHEALASVDIEGLETELCPLGVPPESGPDGAGLTVGQAAWRACEVPDGLVPGLSAQIARTMNCLEAGALLPLTSCAGAGCTSLSGPGLRLLDPRADSALVAASRALGRNLELTWAFRDVALGHFVALAAERRACEATPEAGRSALDGAFAVAAPAGADREVAVALRAAGFEDVEDESAVFRLPGDDHTALNVLAFQRLWNLNRPDGLALEEDGLIGPATRGAIADAPLQGFDDEPCPPEEVPMSGGSGGSGGGAPPAGGESDVPSAGSGGGAPGGEESPSRGGSDDAGEGGRDFTGVAGGEALPAADAAVSEPGEDASSVGRVPPPIDSTDSVAGQGTGCQVGRREPWPVSGGVVLTLALMRRRRDRRLRTRGSPSECPRDRKSTAAPA